MASEGNGGFKRLVWAVLTAIIIMWAGWASLSISALNMDNAVTKSQFAYISKALDRIECALNDHMKEASK